MTAANFSVRRQPKADRTTNLRGAEQPARAAYTTPVQAAILQVLRARGGKLWMVDLVFELRCRGTNADLVRSELGRLVELGLVRGPLSSLLAYELTPGGWHAASAR